MIHYLYVKAPTEADWSTLFDAHLAKHRTEVDVIGTILHDTGTTTTTDDGVETPVMAPVPGYHVNLVLHAEEVPAALFPYLVNPQQPKRVFLGSYILSAPEALPDDGDTVPVQRGIGQAIDDATLAVVEEQHVRRKLSREEREDRRALHEATLAVIAKRVERDAAAAARDAAADAVDPARASRDDLVAQRTAQQAIRDDAIANLATLTGAARLPQVARRDAAAAELTRLAPLIVAANAALDAAVATRKAAVAVAIARGDELQQLRAARAAALAVVQAGDA